MSEIDGAFSEMSGAVGDDDYTPDRSPNSQLDGLEKEPNHTANGQDPELDAEEPERHLDRQETIKPDRVERISGLVSGTQNGGYEFPGGIRWAPLNIGLERRLTMLVVLWHTLSISVFLTSFFFSCAIPLFWPLLLPYLIYISLFSKSAVDGSLSCRSKLLRSLPIWTYFAAYFPARLHRSTHLPSTRKYIFGYHPHGIISHGAFVAFGTEALGFSDLFPGITNTLLTLDSNFRLPFYRDYALAMGLASVSRESCENLLSRGGHDNAGMGRAITIVVGGARESLNARPNCLRLVLRRRRGFIKLAIRTGADLVPVLAFGENDIYEQVSSHQRPIVKKLQTLMRKTLGFTIPLFHARGVFNYDVGLMPYRRPVNVVVGRPIHVVQKKAISERYVDELQDQYVKELKRLFVENRERFGVAKDVEMEIIE